MSSFDFESALVTAIIDSKDIRTSIKQKITSEFFNNTSAKAAYIFLLQWYQNPNYGDVPSWESFQHSFENFDPVRVEESLIAICDKIRSAKLYADLAGLLTSVGEEAMGDPNSGFELLRKLTSHLAMEHIIDSASDVSSSLEDLKAEYMMMKSGATGLKGKPYPWDALNRATLGLQNQHLVFIYGRPKSGKTWLALETVRCLHANGAKPIIFSQELSDIEVKRRYVALATNVDYGLYLRGALPPEVEEEFFDNLSTFEELEPVIVTSLTGQGCDAILTEMSAKIDEYGATVALIDGVYLLGSDWKELALITRAMKRVAKQKNIPLIGTSQANRSRGKKSGDAQDGADDFAYGDSFYQDADLALRVSADIENKKRKEVQIFTAAIREGEQTLFTVNMRLATDLTQKSVQSFGEVVEGDEDNIDQDALDGQEDTRTE
jgi:replicative DNA helicase